MSKAIIKYSETLHTEEVEVDPQSNTIILDDRNLTVEQSSLEAPISGTVYGTFLNYSGELKALGSSLTKEPYKQPPKAPVLYIKPVNTITGFNSSIPLPEDTSHLQIGASLGIVIGKNATRVTEEKALDHVLGYTIVNDVSIPHENFYRPAIKQKARDNFCPVGPWIIERDAISDPNKLAITVFVNDELKQKNTTANLIRPVSKLISEISGFMTLYEGDVLLVGVPENPPLVKEGDRVRIEIDGIGYLENTVK
ncbi:fumarylacetoacetate hydrolase family protein [Lysinibacillus sp. JNUCC 51]|uniref:fumarylacetoacetate hydrolase family protein n=1 Tax=Lysinibacillus sp. JNUCC-51 TaxID=2792479 RepID=UPI001936AD81|nr:fumarylacetoacetate hydrolase family protein [Lysinibacillus sp. JNUCC-51]